MRTLQAAVDPAPPVAAQGGLDLLLGGRRLLWSAVGLGMRMLLEDKTLYHHEPDLVERIAYRELNYGAEPDGGPLDPAVALREMASGDVDFHAEPYRLKVFDHVVVRDGRPGVPIYSWWVAEDWDDMHEFDVAVALIGDDGTVTTAGERLQFWPYRHETLDEDLRAAGLEPETTSYEPDVPNYVVTARRPPASAASGRAGA